MATRKKSEQNRIRQAEISAIKDRLPYTDHLIVLKVLGGGVCHLHSYAAAVNVIFCHYPLLPKGGTKKAREIATEAANSEGNDRYTFAAFLHDYSIRTYFGIQIYHKVEYRTSHSNEDSFSERHGLNMAEREKQLLEMLRRAKKLGATRKEAYDISYAVIKNSYDTGTSCEQFIDNNIGKVYGL